MELWQLAWGLINGITFPFIYECVGRTQGHLDSPNLLLAI